MTLYDHLVARFEELESTLNNLDAAAGDGDHGTTILKGVRAAAEAEAERARAFRAVAGGASGSLFSRVIAALERVEAGTVALGPALSQAAEQIAQLGQAQPGDKTMLDALLPAAAAADTTPSTPEQAAAVAARGGADSTIAMAAARGRARHVEGRGVGHVDAGATSVAEILEVYQAWRASK